MNSQHVGIFMLIIHYPLKVVIVDDDKDMLELMSYYIQGRDDYEPVIFTNPKEALDWMRHNEVQIAILDINMNSMKGDELIREINELGSGTEVIIVTASNQLMNFAECYRQRASGFLFKPLSKNSFLETLDRCHTNIMRWNFVFKEMLHRKHHNSK